MQSCCCLLKIAWFFFPLFCSIPFACLFLLLIAPERFAGRFVVRFGVLLRAFVAGITVHDPGPWPRISLSFAPVRPLFLILAEWGSRRIKPGWRVGYFTLLTIIVFSIGIVLWRPSLSLESLRSLFIAVPFGALIAILAAAPIFMPGRHGAHIHQADQTLRNKKRVPHARHGREPGGLAGGPMLLPWRFSVLAGHRVLPFPAHPRLPIAI